MVSVYGFYSNIPKFFAWNGWLVETPELPVFLDMCSVVSNLDDVHRSLSRYPSWYSSFIGVFFFAMIDCRRVYIYRRMHRRMSYMLNILYHGCPVIQGLHSFLDVSPHFLPLQLVQCGGNLSCNELFQNPSRLTLYLAKLRIQSTSHPISKILF